MPSTSPHTAPGWRFPGRFVLGPILLSVCLLSSSCAQGYTIVTANGAEIYSRGRPKLSGGYYVYTDANGQEQRVNSLRVRSIEAR